MWVCSFSGEVKSECVDSNQQWCPLSNCAKNKSAESMFPPELYADWARVHIFLHAALHEEVERHAVNPPWLWMGWSWRHASHADTLAQFPEAVKHQQYIPLLPLIPLELSDQVPQASRTVLKVQSIDLPSGIVVCPEGVFLKLIALRSHSELDAWPVFTQRKFSCNLVRGIVFRDFFIFLLNTGK